MLKLEGFLQKYHNLIWVILMFTLCLMDTIVLFIDFNIWSLIGAVCCGISCVLNSIAFVADLKKFKE